MNKWIFRGILFAALLIGGIYLTPKIVYTFSHESVDNAYVTGTIVPISAEIRGRIVHVHVKDNQFVAAGTPLLEIYPDDYTAIVEARKEAVTRLGAEEREMLAAIVEREKSLVQARANLLAAASEENLAAKEVERYKNLFSEELISQSQFDRSESVHKVAHARKESSAAALAGAETAIETLRARIATQKIRIREAQISSEMAKLDLQRTIVKAPISGRVAQKNVDAGKYVQTGQTLLAIVKDETWIVANFKETQIKKMAVGQSVEIKVDAYPGVTFKGHIDSLQAGTGSVFSLLPPENATGNFVKVVQRLPVKIIVDSPFDPDHPLLPGLSVTPYVDVRKKTGPKLVSK
ncbi:MAG: HlyD family secretion protein [Deltaproteobacteria bacterium]|nr:HlyD family secretion protein [Deltaproteobacteria bacterium]